MPVQSIECQLTQAQVKRYLAGADFPDEIVAAVERHLKACPDCMAEANRQRESLGGAPAEIAQAVVAQNVKSSPLDKIKALAKRDKVATTPPQGLIAPRGEKPYPADPLKAIKTPKNLILSGSLAAVLVVMSTVMKNPTNVFGPRASSQLSAARTEASEATTAKGDPEASGVQADAHGPAQSGQKDPVEESKVPSPKTDETEKPTGTEEPVTPVHESEPTTTKTEKASAAKPVGGEVVVAESTPKVAKPTRPKPLAPRPQAKKIVRPKTKAAPKRKPATSQHKSQVKVYLPDGSVKKN